jgi:hypothetical protein
MKKVLINLDEEKYVALPGGVTINAGGSMEVLNPEFLELPEVQEMLTGQNPRLKLKVVTDSKI